MSVSIKTSALGLLAMAASAMAGPVSLQRRVPDPSAFQNDMLRGHNFFREQHQAVAVTWNDQAAAYSQDKVNSCVWGHQNPIEGYGENIFGGGFGSWLDVTNGWGGERVNYDWNNPDFSSETGHFTQVVWTDTTSIGCAWNDCGDGNGGGATGVYVVCKYAPAGNYLGQFADKVLPQTIGSPTDILT